MNFALLVNATLPGSHPTTATIGDVYTVVNAQNLNCSPSTDCGDTGQAQSARLSVPWGLAFDHAGNLYIADIGSASIRKVSAQDGTISTYAGDPLHGANTYNGDGGQALGAFLTAPSFIALDGSDNLYIADSVFFSPGTNLVRRVDAQTGIITTVAGDNTQPGVVCSDNVCGEGQAATSALLGGLNGVAVTAAGDIFTAESNENVVRRVDHATGIITIIAGQMGVACADNTCGGEGVPATQASLNFPFAVTTDSSGDPIITDQNDNVIRGVLPDGTIRTLAGIITKTPGLGPLTGPAGSALFYLPENAALDASGNLFIADINNNLLWKVNAPVALKAQTITFDEIPAATYGDPPIDLTRYASSDSALALTFTCTGAASCAGAGGATLSITGSGAATVIASQAGNSVYAPAAAQTVTFQVARAALTVQADDIYFAYMSASQLPPLTFKYRGLVNGDTKSALSGAPLLTITATATSPGGDYPITLTLRTLSAANYTLTPANGTLHITGNGPQTLTFPALPNVTYGVATFDLGATASSGLPVSYTVAGPAELLGFRLTVSGAGTITVTATQPGNSNYAAAVPVVEFFVAAPAVLTITAQPVTREYAMPTPALSYSAVGFVSADTVAVLSGAPAFTTTATATSVPSIYPLTISQGTLFANNYTFLFVNSTVTVVAATQIITFPSIGDQVFAGQPVTLQASASSGLAVQYALTGPATLTGNAVGTFSGGVAARKFALPARAPGHHLVPGRQGRPRSACPLLHAPLRGRQPCIRLSAQPRGNAPASESLRRRAGPEHYGYCRLCTRHLPHQHRAGHLCLRRLEFSVRARHPDDPVSRQLHPHVQSDLHRYSARTGTPGDPHADSGERLCGFGKHLLRWIGRRCYLHSEPRLSHRNRELRRWSGAGHRNPHDLRRRCSGFRRGRHGRENDPDRRVAVVPWICFRIVSDLAASQTCALSIFRKAAFHGCSPHGRVRLYRLWVRIQLQLRCRSRSDHHPDHRRGSIEQRPGNGLVTVEYHDRLNPQKHTVLSITLPLGSTGMFPRVLGDDERQTVTNQVRQLRELAAVGDPRVRDLTCIHRPGNRCQRKPCFIPRVVAQRELTSIPVILITDLDCLTRDGAAPGFATWRSWTALDP